MQIFDTHAHIGLIFDDPIERLRVVQKAKLAGVTRIVSICNSLHDFEQVYPQLKSVSGVYHAVGVAPSEVTTPGKNWIQTIENGLKLPNVVAVGETGLDYFRKFGDKRSQIELFITQLEIAQKYNKPVIIHNRDATEDILRILKECQMVNGKCPNGKYVGVVHCFNGSKETAQQILDMGFYLGIGGVITFKNCKLADTLKQLNQSEIINHKFEILNRLVLETDAPYMAPVPHRGERNESRLMIHVAERLAQVFECSVDEIIATTTRNAQQLFHLS